MTNNQKILLGLSAVALGYYLYVKSKKGKLTQSTRNPCKNEGEVPCNNGSGKCYMIDVQYAQDPCKVDKPKTNTCTSGKPFIVINDVINGVVPCPKDKICTHQAKNVIFMKGDFVCGEVITKFIFNKNMKGILAKPTVVGAYSETSLEFIPIDNLKPTSLS